MIEFIEGTLRISVQGTGIIARGTGLGYWEYTEASKTCPEALKGRQLEPGETAYIVTHLQSGLALPFVFWQEKSAQIAIERLSKIFNWGRCGSELASDPEYKRVQKECRRIAEEIRYHEASGTLDELISKQKGE